MNKQAIKTRVVYCVLYRNEPLHVVFNLQAPGILLKLFSQLKN